jgi:hypothetical protein
MSELDPGSRVRVRADIDYQPYTTIPVGTGGFVVGVTVATVLVSWDAPIKGLERWDNVAMLEYYEAMDALEVIPVVVDPGEEHVPTAQLVSVLSANSGG